MEPLATDALLLAVLALPCGVVGFVVAVVTVVEEEAYVRAARRGRDRLVQPGATGLIVAGVAALLFLLLAGAALQVLTGVVP